MKCPTSSIQCLLMLTFLLLLNACAPNTPYHTLDGSLKNCVAHPEQDTCLQSYYQEYDGFDLAFAEFSERGNAFNDKYQKKVLEQVKKQATEENGIVLITFIHGWKHNASNDDDNLKQFKESLGTISKLLRKQSLLDKRRLVGVYIGWRGANVDFPVLKEMTFWDRKQVAEEVGKGGVTEFLLELDHVINRKPPIASEDKKANREPDNNIMVVIGHSFGGAIVVSALNEVLMERAINTTRKNGYIRNLGDGIILLNPAIEANQALNLVEATLLQDKLQSEQRPLLISLSSDADWATHKAFPFGQTLSLIATWRQTDLDRDYYYDRQKPDQVFKLKEEHLDTTAVGNFAPFLSHHLSSTELQGKTEFNLVPCKNDPSLCEPAGWTTLSGQPTIRTPENFPLFFIRTDSTIMKGHNDIFNDKVRSFLYTVIDNVVRNKLKPRAAAKPSEKDKDFLKPGKEVNFEKKMKNYFIPEDQN
jgi:hypothetical protein